MTKDLALICGDGGIKGGFIAGAATALLSAFPDEMLNVKTIVASSASVGSMFYFLSHGLSHPGRKIWTEALAAKDFINYDSPLSMFSRRPIYDIDHLVYKIFKVDNPLNIDAIKKSTTEFYFPLQNYDTCEVEYFSNTGSGEFVRGDKIIKVHDFRQCDLYDLIKAASAAPFVYDKWMVINGKRYIDAATLEPFAIDLPTLRGKAKIVVVSKMDFRFRRNLYYYMSGWLWPIFVGPLKRTKFKRAVYLQYARKPFLMRRLDHEAEVLQAADDLIFIKPLRKLGANTDNSPGALRANFEHGENVVKQRLTEIREFLHRRMSM
jgi:predicted patatin/cPLA2 family phospholipase